MAEPTDMRREIAEIPQATARLLDQGGAAIRATADALRQARPQLVLSVARGSSDHAATYLKYACELTLGVPVASVGPSLASIYGAELALGPSACLAISQSGQSPDIVAMAASARRQGALSVAITNDANSPLARACVHTLDIHAGPEKSVAATKTFVTSLVAGLALLAHWKSDAALLAAIDALPDQFAQALAHDWPELRAALAGHDALYVLGRGTSLAMSDEAALKFKETCRIQAESYSSAEVMHGPVAVVGPGFPVLALTARDAAESSGVAVADMLAAAGASVFVTSDKARTATRLEVVATGHPLTDPLPLIVSFYACIEKLALERGFDPDHPRGLRKVTETV